MSSPRDLKARAREFLETLCNKKELEKGMEYADANVVQYHDDMPPIKGADNMLAAFTKMVEFMSDFHFEVKDMVQEGNKVWVFGRITGLPGGVVKDSVMTVWNEEGKLVSTKDVQRVVSEEA